MNIVRPPGGFKIIVSQVVAEYIETECADNFRIRQFWSDILERIKFTALREGHKVPGKSPPHFTFIADGAHNFNIPTIQIVYYCFSDTLTITAALVWTEGDCPDEL